ncbi:MAG: type II and III secretion system protein family protein [Planctomycetota bacterium]
MSDQIRRFAAILCLAAVAVPAAAQTDPTISADEVERIAVNVGQSVLIDAPWPVARVSITQTEIADVQVLTPMHLLLTGNSLGSTTLILWNEEDEPWHARVSVVVDLMYIEDELKRLFPECDLSVYQSGDIIAVRGSLCRAEQSVQFQQFLDAMQVKYIDMTDLAGIQQVLLEVRVAEASRDATRALGINYFHASDSFFGGNVLGSASGGQLNPLNIGIPEGSVVGSGEFSFLSDTSVGGGVTLFGGFPGSDLAFFIQALAENSYLRLLAEPSLVAMSGEEASFLAGGEFPVPIVQGSAAGGGTSITVEYKEFGIQLRFRPTVLGDNTIRLLVAPEVSDLSEFGAVEIEGFTIPAVVVRRAETTLELKSGQTFAIAGLLNQSVTARRTRIPFFGDLPVIGPLFRSVRYTNGETELLVLVTASLVEPVSTVTRAPVPGDLHVEPSDWEKYIDGRIEGRTAPLAPADAAWMKEMGFDQLKGPGAWTSFEQPRAMREIRDLPAPAPEAEAPAEAAPAEEPAPGAVSDDAPTIDRG